jgi:hypothetical protein
VGHAEPIDEKKPLAEHLAQRGQRLGRAARGLMAAEARCHQKAAVNAGSPKPARKKKRRKST